MSKLKTNDQLFWHDVYRAAIARDANPGDAADQADAALRVLHERMPQATGPAPTTRDFEAHDIIQRLVEIDLDQRGEYPYEDIAHLCDRAQAWLDAGETAADEISGRV